MKMEKIGKIFRGIFAGALFLLVILALYKGYAPEPPVDMLTSGEVVNLNHEWEKERDEDSQSMVYRYRIPETMDFT